MREKLSIETDWLVFGLGETGLSCARFLARRGQPFSVIDTRADPPGADALHSEFPQTFSAFGVDDVDSFGTCRQLLVSPGIPLNHPIVAKAKRAGIEVIGDVELFSRHRIAPVLAVTGSNGKSTVVTMVTRILEAAGIDVRLGGNIGTPVLDLLNSVEPDCYVLELSSFQLESTNSLSAHAACILNVTPDHLDRYVSFDDYLAAKLRIVADADNIILNADDPNLSELKFPRNVQHVACAANDSAAYCLSADGLMLQANGQPLVAVEALSEQGAHYIFNALCAVAMTDTLGVNQQVAAKVLSRFESLPHRLQWVARTHEIDWFNDSKGTNVGATCAAIRSIFSTRQGVLIAGGVAKGADFGILADSISRDIRSVILIGRDASLIAKAIESVVEVHYALTMDAAVALAGTLAMPGDAVLLSPACASFDMFENYEARGEAFINAVKQGLES